MEQLNWEKQGLIFSPSGEYPWLKTHGMLPTAELLGTDLVKIYFGSRNDDNQSHLGWIIYDLLNREILDYAREPILAPGKLGTFDDNGVLPSSVIDTGSKKLMYYIGFKPGGTTRMDLFGGVSSFTETGGLQRVSEAPIIERCSVNPYINTAPFVIANYTNHQSKYFMYYVAGCGWLHKDLPKYNIQIAFSDDGITWSRDGTVCIDFQDDNELALARPYVIFYENMYRMWFSYKGDAYKIGYAESQDGVNWKRLDSLGGMTASAEEDAFDSDMVAYGCVVPYKNQLFMFYNGNNYGYSGIGLAIANV